MTADLTAWLRAQLDEDERIALAAAKDGETWRAGSEGEIYPSDESRHPGAIVTGPWGGLEDEHQAHIVCHDPARELAEVAAKRAILETCRITGPDAAFIATGRDLHPGDDTELAARVLLLLAQPYATRVGRRTEWRL